MKLLIGLVAVASLLANPPLAPVPNRQPLRPNAFYSLPLGSVRPAGWLKQQLRLQADGLTGHLDELWPNVSDKSAWLGGDGDSSAGGPQYLDGLIALAAVLDDQPLMTKARKWVDYTLEHQRADGAIGPETKDWWPGIVMLKALTGYQEATGDERIVPALEKYFAWQAAQLDENPLHDAAQYRWGDELVSLIWLYNRNGDEKLLDLGRKLSSQAFDWKALFAEYPFKTRIEKADGKLESHGVNNAMALKTGALWSQISGDDTDRALPARMIETLEQYHGLPGGTFSAEEHMGGREPSGGTELCAVVEHMFSLEQLIQVTGDAHLANRLERLAYNALPAAFAKDMWTQAHVQRMNQPQATAASANAFALQPNDGCCVANMHQGWPKFVASLWMGSADNGLVAVNYSPSEVHTTVNDVAVRISETTNYPFSEEVSIIVDPEKAVSFPLRLRIPGWTSGVVVRINGAAQREIKPGSFLTINREWHSGDTILLKMPMPVMVSHTYRDAVFVSRGPLLYSLAIGERWKKVADHGPAADWEVTPTSPWNYALAVNEHDPQSSFSVQIKAMSKQPFSFDGTPVQIHARGFMVRDWKLQNGLSAPVPASPVKSSGAGEDIVLIPYAAAKLRITEFPEVVKR